MYGQEEMPLSISEDEEVGLIHIIEVFIIISHDIFCQSKCTLSLICCVIDLMSVPLP